MVNIAMVFIYVNQSWFWDSFATDIVKRAHAVGTKAILMFGGEGSNYGCKTGPTIILTYLCMHTCLFLLFALFFFDKLYVNQPSQNMLGFLQTI